jgi:hypothetical protein
MRDSMERFRVARVMRMQRAISFICSTKRIVQCDENTNAIPRLHFNQEGKMNKKTIELVRGGVTHSARYFVTGELLTVNSEMFGRKSVRVAGRAPEDVARSLLEELVVDHQQHAKK